MVFNEIGGFAEALGFGYYILVYAIGIVAMALSVVAFQFKRRVTIIISNFLGQSCWVLYFLLQGDLTSAIACALSALMLAVFAKRDKWNWVKSPFCILFFIVILYFLGCPSSIRNRRMTVKICLVKTPTLR